MYHSAADRDRSPLRQTAFCVAGPLPGLEHDRRRGITDCDASSERMAAYRSEGLAHSLSQLDYSTYNLAIIETSSISGLLWGCYSKDKHPPLKHQPSIFRVASYLLGCLPAWNTLQDPPLGHDIPFTSRYCGQIKFFQATMAQKWG